MSEIKLPKSNPTYPPIFPIRVCTSTAFDCVIIFTSSGYTTEIPNSLPAELASVMTPSPTKGNNKKLTKSPNPNHVSQTTAAENQQQQPRPAEVVKNLQLQMQKRRGNY